MVSADVRQRTQSFALDVIRLAQALPRNRGADVIGGQLLRAGTSVGAKSQFWLELLVESGLVDVARVSRLRDEANQLVAIVVASITTARGARGDVPRSTFHVPRSR